jgi:putative oxidoreductase
MTTAIAHVEDRYLGWLTKIYPIAEFAMRLYVASVFFRSGWSKLSDWETTLYLFREEYHVPLLQPVLAAACATAGELVLSALLAIGLLKRLSAAGLFVLNGVAVISYYGALMSAPAAMRDHIEWGLMLAVLATVAPRRGPATA